ncbi:GNAT family N-acetyltransferase [Halobacillus hunanensis]|uniref:GNAT family N-acetyltransferase n=1 Tax=Halobacillus hunanensis TaxID=578214 RepID=UPI001FE287CE|nr:GNAT family N-acetyltransferase [Halobacillus hunanensis]
MNDKHKKTTIDGDQTMKEDGLLALFHQELRLEASTPGYTREVTEHLVRHVAKQKNEKGFIICSHVNAENAAEIIDYELDYFNNLDQEFEWKVYSYDQPHNLKNLLIQKGFEMEEEEALMVLELNKQHHLITRPASVFVEEIRDMEGIEEIIALENTIWGEPHNELGEKLWRDKQNDPDSLFLYGVYDKGFLVSAAWMYIEPNSSFASLWGGSTLPSQRGKGYYTALLAVRAKQAYGCGRKYLTADARPMSRPILEKYGFACLAYTYGCHSPSHK